MIILNKNELQALKFIDNYSGNITDYQLNRFLVTKMDPDDLLITRTRIRQLNLAELFEFEGHHYWRVMTEWIDVVDQDVKRRE